MGSKPLYRNVALSCLWFGEAWPSRQRGNLPVSPINGNLNIQGFSAKLSWSHYREIMKFEHVNARMFFEIEAEMEGWSVRHLINIVAYKEG